MRDGISWRGSHRDRRRQQECYNNPDIQSLVLREARSRRAANVLVLFLILFFFVTWTLTRFRTTAPSISSQSLPHPAPARAVVLKLFRYHRQACNRIFTASVPAHRRRRSFLEDSAPQELFDEEELEEQLFDGQGVGGNLTRQFDPFKRRSGSHSAHAPMASHQEASSSTFAARGTAEGKYKWPAIGGVRKSDRVIQPLFAEVPIGYDGKWRDFHLIIDTGSGTTWVNCVGSTMVGDNGLFHPAADSFLNCKENRELCKDFQGAQYPCDERHKFRCLFKRSYVDGSEAGGSIIKAEVRFDLSDGSAADRINMGFGCADEGIRAHPTDENEDSSDENGDTMDEPTSDEDEDIIDEPSSDGASDGVLGLGLHPLSWLRQLYEVGFVSERVVAVCLEPRLKPKHPVQIPSPSFIYERAGFISFGGLYTTYAASTVWTTSILRKPTNHEMEDVAVYEARLVEIKYRDKLINLMQRKRQRNGEVVIRGQRMGFDMGSEFTYLPEGIFLDIETILAKDAKRMGYKRIQEDSVRNSVSRTCWWDKRARRKSLVGEFGDLIMRFSSLADDTTTSDFVIKPEYYLTSGGVEITRTCFNMRQTKLLRHARHDCFLRAEAMRGHLLLFREVPDRIGWIPVTSCDNLS